MAMGSTGLSSAEQQAPGDLDAVYHGGEGYADRMKAYATQLQDLIAQKNEAMKALAALNVGKSIKAAQDKAKADLEAARNAREQADGVLADAKAQAAKVISDAKAQADEIVRGAAASVAEVRATGDAEKKSAKLDAAKARKDAESLLADAKARQDAASAAQAAAEKVRAEAESVRAASAKVLKDAQATQKQFEDKLAKLQAAIAG